MIFNCTIHTRTISKHPTLTPILIALLLALSACTQPQQQSSPNDDALLNDNMIDGAIFELAEGEEAIYAFDEIDDEGMSSEEEMVLSELSDSDLSTQAVFANSYGIVCYVQYDSRAARWKIIAFYQESNTQQTIYSGTREIQSVACDAEGTTYVFSMRERRASASDFELYRYRAGRLSRLTRNNIDDSNVSMGDDSKIIVWERKRAGKQTVHYRRGRNVAFLANSNHQMEPSISYNGQYISFVRLLSNGKYWVMRYSVATKRYKGVYSSSQSLSHPSISDRGGNVAWTQNGNKARYKNLPSNNITTVIQGRGAIEHMHMTSNATWMTAVINNQVYTVDVKNKRIKRGTGYPRYLKQYAPYWAYPKMGTLRVDVSGLLGTLAKAKADIHISSPNRDSGETLSFVGPGTQSIMLKTGSYDITALAVKNHKAPSSIQIEISNNQTSQASIHYSLKGFASEGVDNDNPANSFIQPAGEESKQHMENTDVLYAKGNYGNLMFGVLGRDTIVGGAYDDISVGGPENFVGPNSDAIYSAYGDDINIWAPGDGSDAFVGGEGKDVMIFAPFKNQSAPGAVPTLHDANGRDVPQVIAVNRADKPLFSCTIEALSAADNLGYDFLVRFAVNGDIKVTVRLKDVEWVICPGNVGTQTVKFANLASSTTFSNKPLNSYAHTLLGEILQLP